MGVKPVKFCKIHKIPISGITGKCRECEEEEIIRAVKAGAQKFSLTENKGGDISEEH
jgi:hypothetical protein